MPEEYGMSIWYDLLQRLATEVLSKPVAHFYVNQYDTLGTPAQQTCRTKPPSIK